MTHPALHLAFFRPLATVLLAIGATGASLPARAAPDCPPVLQHSLLRLQDEKPVPLCQYSGKVVLVVNTASFCGYTTQYRSLEALSERYRSQGLVVLGFPSNDFSQEPGSGAAIAEFCENTFGVKFPMFAKSSVTAAAGRTVNPLFAALARRSGEAPAWNFHKYLIGRDGQTVLSVASAVDPKDPAFTRDLEKLLKAK
jgi:glutathione peroxidase